MSGGAWPAAVDAARLWQRHMDLARIGATPRGGVNRAALSAEDAQARELIGAWAAARDFSLLIDEAGNLFVRREGSDPDAPPVVTGSHIDSQPTGGRFDGAYGVLAGLEVLEAAADAGLATRHPLEVAIWMNEEGSRFQPATMGSAVYAGAMRLEDALAVTDRDGISVGDALPAARAATPGAAPRPFGTPFAAYVEAHIEQGPILEERGQVIGAVTGIQGCRWFQIEVAGQEAHAGTTPVAARRDAFVAAMRMVAALHEAMRDPADVTRFTVGRFEVSPNSPNTVPGRVLFTVDFRHPDGAALRRLGDQVAPLCEAAAEGLPVTVRETYHVPPIAFDPAVVGAVREATAALGLPGMDIVSGALHDAKFMNDLCASGMIFIPCAGGLSHNEAEAATPEHVAAGARVLAAVLGRLAGVTA